MNTWMALHAPSWRRSFSAARLTWLDNRLAQIRQGMHRLPKRARGNDLLRGGATSSSARQEMPRSSFAVRSITTPKLRRAARQARRIAQVLHGPDSGCMQVRPIRRPTPQTSPTSMSASSASISCLRHGGQVAHAIELGIFLGDVIGELCQRF